MDQMGPKTLKQKKTNKKKKRSKENTAVGIVGVDNSSVDVTASFSSFRLASAASLFDRLHDRFAPILPCRQ